MSDTYELVPRHEREKTDSSLDWLKDPNDPTITRPKPRGFRHERLCGSSTSSSILCLVSHILGLLWIGPIAALLVLNFKSHIIGASAWCPSGHCIYNSFSAFEGTGLSAGGQSKLDRRDHDLIGALQFVGKAIEVWFVFIASSFVYDVAMILARGSHGLPLGYFLTHLQFSDILSLLDPRFWTSVQSIPKHTGRRSQFSSRLRLYLFVALVVFLTCLSNLVGPSIIALIQPTQQWVPVIENPDQIFQGLNSAQPPFGDEVFPDCASDDLEAQLYNCTNPTSASALDSMVTFAESVIRDSNNRLALKDPLSEEAIVTFTFNDTTNNSIIWIPNRPVLRNISIDLSEVILLQLEEWNQSRPVIDSAFSSSLNRQRLLVLNSSLANTIERRGPTIGWLARDEPNCHSGTLLEISVPNTSNNQSVRCFSSRNLTDDASNNYTLTECFRFGQGWNQTNSFQIFSLEAASGTDAVNQNFSAPETTVLAYFSDKATFFNATTDFGSGMAQCYADSQKNNGVAADSCDWDKIFSTEMPPFLLNITKDVLNVEYQHNGGPFPDDIVWCDSVAYSANATYSLDPNPSTNSAFTVRLHDLPSDVTSLSTVVIDPTWLLAAWSVNPNWTVSSNRSLVSNMQRTVEMVQRAGRNWTESELDEEVEAGAGDTIIGQADEFQTFHAFTIFQALSMINYNFTNATGTKGGNPNDPVHPTFYLTVSARVWTFGLNSRTAYVGVAVSCLGILVTLSRSLLGLYLLARGRVPKRISDTELLIAALEHKYQGEFRGLDNEYAQAKLRYRLEGSDGETKLLPQNRDYSRPQQPVWR
ncbi:MAG: hypothetical protein M1820_008059 [Bogoriella megaspora]|nr:MAG: hypothetical protein M1820_008059 [Bogoriella megaspora]